MGNSDSKLSFKQGIFRLGSSEPIHADDPYWRIFYELPSSPDDISSLFSAADIRRARQASVKNLETLIRNCADRLITLGRSRFFPHAEAAPEKQALNCIRVLTRILPFIYEDETLTGWQDALLWEKRVQRKASCSADVLFDDASPDAERLATKEATVEELRPLGEELIDTLLDLLFFTNFTVPAQVNGTSKVTYAIWNIGIGCTTSMTSTGAMDRNRIEVMRLLLSLTSKALYISSSNLISKSTPALTYLATYPDKQVVLSLLCSQLNTILNYQTTTWQVPFEHVMLADSRELLITYSLELLLILLTTVPPVSSEKRKPRNMVRHFAGKIHRLQDLQFITSEILRILNYPIQALSTYIPGSQKPLTWAPELLILLWELLQSNPRLLTFIIDSTPTQDLTIILFFYILTSQSEAAEQGTLRIGIFLLQTVSTERNWARLLNVELDTSTIPLMMRVPGFKGTKADYIVTQLCDLLMSRSVQGDAICPAILAIMKNMARGVEGMAEMASKRVLRCFGHFSSRTFLLAKDGNHVLLRDLLECMAAFVEGGAERNLEFVKAVRGYRGAIEGLRAWTLSGRLDQKDRGKEIDEHGDATFAIGDDDDDDNDDDSAENEEIRSEMNSQGGLSEKARGKLPAESGALMSTGTSTPTNASLVSGVGFMPTTAWLEGWQALLPLHTMLQLLDGDMDVVGEKESELIGFEWTAHSRGWYLSLLWGLLFQRDLVTVSNGGGMWKETTVKLFRVQRGGDGVGAGRNVGILRARGAVDAVGNRLVEGIGGLALRAGAPGPGQGQDPNGFVDV